jgi:hypothetical protein
LPQCSANILQQLVQPHSVLRYDVASGAVYNVKATSAQLDLSQLPGGVSYAAVQPPEQQQDPVASPAPIDAGGDNATGEDNNDEEEPPYILEPEIVVDLPIKRNSSTPSPSPALPEVSSNTSNSASPSPAVMPEAEINSSNNSSSGSGSPVPAVDGSEAQASPSPAAALSGAGSADANPSSSPAVSSASNTAAAASTRATVADDHEGSNSSVGRKLRFVRKGNDERTDVSSRPAFPLSAVGQLLSHGQEWHCSASLIAERTIITAAHCVYDPVTGSWAKSLLFAPSRFRDAAGSVTAPAGTAAVAEVFIVGGFAVGEPQFLWEKDMAVVKLAVGTKLARKLGHLGIFLPAAIAHQQRAARVESGEGADVPASSGSTTGSGRKLKLQHQAAPATAGVSSSGSSSSKAKSIWSGMLSTAGYPNDRQQGTLVTTKCLSQVMPGTTPRAATLKLQRCRTALGQSGGPLIDAAGNVGGVVSYEVLGPQGYNGGCAMTPWLWLNLVSPSLV